MARVRFYYDVNVFEEDIMINRDYQNEKEIKDEDIIERAKCIFDNDIYDRAIVISELECEIIEY